MYYTVYKITNKINEKIYIGVHQTRDLDDGYYGSGKSLRRAIEKYGIENFEKEILYLCESPEEMFAKEAEIVNEGFIARDDTYNLKVGGTGGWDYVNRVGANLYYDEFGKCMNGNPENLPPGNKVKELLIKRGLWEKHKSKLSRAMKKWCANNNNSFLGRTHTEETKRKIGEKNSKHQSGKGNSQYGTCWIYSEEEKRSMKIKKEELASYVKLGWKKGRKMKF